jgi:hypothetical protein
MKPQNFEGCCYEVRVYDKDMKLKYTIPHKDVLLKRFKEAKAPKYKPYGMFGGAA